MSERIPLEPRVADHSCGFFCRPDDNIHLCIHRANQPVDLDLMTLQLAFLMDGAKILDFREAPEASEIAPTDPIQHPYPYRYAVLIKFPT